MPRIPDFASVGFNDPRAAGGTPQFPTSDPVAAAQEQFGAGLQKAGTAASVVSTDMEERRQKLNAANSSIGFMNELIPLHTQMQIETDPGKLGEIKTQLGGLLEKYAKGIDDPATKEAWLSQHTNAALAAVTDVDKRYATLDRERTAAGLHENIDTAARNAAVSGDPNAIGAAEITIRNLAKYGEDYGALKPGEGYTAQRQALNKMVRGAADNLINKGQPDAAKALLDAHPDAVDPVTAEVLRRRAEGKSVAIEGDQLANWALGLGPAPKASSSVSVGGAIPRRIADAALSQNVDPTMALATAQIESGMGRNLGSRGNIFQLGNPEWAAAGGGTKGDPETDIRNGIGFLAKTQSDLRSSLGREPQPWEVYLAHQQGVGGAAALLKNPDTPAGKVVPAGNISANGGDPNAPASDFVGKLRDKFTQTAASVGAGASSAPSPADSSSTVAVGDSIAAHLIRKAGVGGQESGKVSVYNKGDTAVSGYNPSEVLTVIQNAPDDAFRGKNVVLSTGTSNDPENKWADSIPAQIAVLRNKGAASVTVMGVGTKYADRNDALAKIAADSGATFSGPLRKVAGDGIHSSDPKAELGAVQSAIGQTGTQAASIASPDAGGTDAGTENTPPGAQGGGPQRNRSGLPSLAETEAKIQNSGASPQAKDYAWSVAVKKYNAMETDAARSERVAAQQRHAQDEELESAIVSDAASPTPKWTAQGVMTDTRLSPEARIRMLNFLSSVSRKAGDHDSNTYGQGFYTAFQAIHAPEGDPNRITSPDQLYSRVGPNGDLTVAGLEKLRGEIMGKRTPEGEAESALKKRFFDYAKSQLSYSVPELHIPDAKGDELMLKLAARFYPAYAAGIKAGKTPEQLLSPESKDSLVNIVSGLKRSRAEEVQDALSDTNRAKGSKNPADYRTPQDLVKAVQEGVIPYDVGVDEARKRGYIPAAPQVPLR